MAGRSAIRSSVMEFKILLIVVACLIVSRVAWEMLREEG